MPVEKSTLIKYEKQTHTLKWPTTLSNLAEFHKVLKTSLPAAVFVYPLIVLDQMAGCK